MNILRKMERILNALIRRGYWFNHVKFKDCRILSSYNTFDTDVVNLGSTSSVHAFDYSDVPLKCGNWALSSNPLMGDLAILKNYFGYLKEGTSTVIIPLCPFSSLAGRYVITEDKYYTILYPSTIPVFSIQRYRQISHDWMKPITSYPLLSLFVDLFHIIPFHRGKIISENGMISDSKRWMNDWMKEFGIANFSYPLSMINQDGIETAASYLNEIINFSRQHNIQPVLLIPPVYHTLGELLKPEIRKLIIDSLVEKVEDKSVWFHNYMDDPAFSHNRDFFYNSFLMNKKGATLFTKRVLKDLKLL